MKMVTRNNVALYGLLFFVVVFLLSSRVFYQSVIICSSYIMYPMFKLHHSVIEPLKQRFRNQQTRSELKETVMRLSNERDALLSENIELRTALHFVHETKELQEFKERYQQQGKVARILMRHIGSDEHYYIVDKGSRHGISDSMIVTYQNCLIGKVVLVFPWYSKIKLITDTTSKIGAYTETTEVNGIYEGKNNSAECCLSFISHMTPLKLDELVLTSGEGLVFPRGFALGRVSATSSNGLYQNVQVNTLINLHTLNYCLIAEM